MFRMLQIMKKEDVPVCMDLLEDDEIVSSGVTPTLLNAYRDIEVKWTANQKYSNHIWDITDMLKACRKSLFFSNHSTPSTTVSSTDEAFLLNARANVYSQRKRQGDKSLTFTFH